MEPHVTTNKIPIENTEKKKQFLKINIKINKIQKKTTREKRGTKLLQQSEKDN